MRKLSLLFLLIPLFWLNISAQRKSENVILITLDGARTQEIFGEFEELMRTRDENKLQKIFSSSVHPENSPIITHIREFAQFRSNDIREELSSLSNAGVGKWILDLTNTALFTLNPCSLSRKSSLTH